MHQETSDTTEHGRLDLLSAVLSNLSNCKPGNFIGTKQKHRMSKPECTVRPMLLHAL